MRVLLILPTLLIIGAAWFGQTDAKGERLRRAKKLNLFAFGVVVGAALGVVVLWP